MANSGLWWRSAPAGLWRAVAGAGDLLAVLAGGLALAAAFPKVGLHALAWVALVPVFVAAGRASLRRAWWLGVAFGVTYRAGTLYWLVYAMTTFGGLPPALAVAAAAAVVGYLAVYQGLFAMAVSRLAPARAATPLLAAAAWTGLELVQTHLLSGFPWALLGYAPGGSPALIQVAELTGVYGLSFVVVAVNGALADLMRSGRAGWRAALAGAVVLVAVVSYGALVIPGSDPGGTSAAALRVGLIQGNVPQDQKWDAALRNELLDRHLALTRDAARRGARLVVWPESSWPDPYGIERDAAAEQRLKSVASSERVAVLVGTVHVYEEPQAGAPPALSVSNAGVLYGAAGEWLGRYDKAHLVPFGEYLPLRRLLGFLGPLVQAVGELRAGPPEQDLLAAPAAGISPFGLAICYEVIFPSIAREQVRRGATFLATITNDAWYGRTSAPYQHFAMARMRAVETRRWLVRSANTGITGIIDPWGRVVARSELFEETVITGAIRPRQGLTPYVRYGDAFAWACLVAGALGAAVGRRRGARAGG